MSDLEKVLDQLVSGDETKAKEIFHKMVVDQSKEEWNKINPEEQSPNVEVPPAEVPQEQPQAEVTPAE